MIDMCQKLFEWLPQCLAQWQAGREDWVLGIVLDILGTCLAIVGSSLSRTLSETRKSNFLSQISQVSDLAKTLTLPESIPTSSTKTSIYSIEDLVVISKRIEASISTHGQIMTTLLNIAAINECML